MFVASNGQLYFDTNHLCIGVAEFSGKHMYYLYFITI